jgi:transposase
MFACDRYAHLNQVRKDFFVSSDFVYRAFYEKLELKRRKDNQYAWPKCIGIDEHGFGRDKVLRKKVFVTMVVNHNRKKLMEVVFGKSSQNLKDRLSHIPGRENVRFATIDMCDPYRNFILNHFPYAEIVADKFHVLRLLSPSIMKERKLITGKNADRKARGLLLCNSKNLDYFDRRAILDYLPRHPKLNALYHAKEALHNFYRIKGYTRAVVALGHMITRFKSSHYEEISRLGRTLENWKSEIQNYFKTRLTNARLEGFNNKASLVRRRAFGYKNPNNYRLRLLSVCS